MVWIKKFKNDIRDYIVQEHEVHMPEITIPGIFENPEYELGRRYEVVLMRDTNEKTGEVKFFWYEEGKQQAISPRFANQQLAQLWMKEREEKYGKT
jgi:hypothetical protein